MFNAIGTFCQAAHNPFQSFQNLITNMAKIQDVASSTISQSQRALIPAYLSLVSNPLVYQVTFLSLLYLSNANEDSALEVPIYHPKVESIYAFAVNCFVNNCITPDSPFPLIINWASPCASQCNMTAFIPPNDEFSNTILRKMH